MGGRHRGRVGEWCVELQLHLLHCSGLTSLGGIADVCTFVSEGTTVWHFWVIQNGRRNNGLILERVVGCRGWLIK